MNKMKRKLWKTPTWYLFLLLVIVSITAVVQVVILNVLPTQYMAAGIAVLFLIIVLLSFMLLNKHVNKINRILGSLLSIIVCIGLIIGNLYLYKTNSFIESVTHDGEQKHEISVVVKESYNVNSIKDLKGTIGTSTSMNDDVVNDFIKDVEEKENLTVETKDVGPLLDMVTSLYNGNNNAILLDESYRSIVNEQETFENFDDETKVIYTYTYYTKIETDTSAVDVTTQPFTVLVTGIDTYGNISTVSRSDVNMIITVNPLTKCIQLVSIPRDYYVETDCDESLGCGIGQMDKLTHTGLHGADTTRATLEKLFGIEINYTLRVNFSSVQNIVDALGGITVDNRDGYAFSIGGYDFTQSIMQLDGDQALMFSRERYSFNEGDRERGRNQMRVIQGMIDKATSQAILTNYLSFLDAVSSSFETDMSSSEIRSLVNMQLSQGGSWTIGSTSVDGTGGTDYCYELGNYAYVMYPDTATVEAAVEAMQQVKDGGQPTNN